MECSLSASGSGSCERLGSECNSTTEVSGPSFAVGEAFGSYSELQDRISKYEQCKFVKFWKRDSRTMKAARVRKYLSEDLVYYEVTFCCIHGGRPFKASGQGMRSTQ